MPRNQFVINQTRTCNTDISAIKATYNYTENSSKQRLPSKVEKLEFLLILLNRLLLGFLCIYIAWMCLRAREIPWHAILCTIGFVCLMSEGLVAHYRGNAWTQLCYRTERTRIHWILQASATLLGIIGISIKFFLEQSHFYTLHGQLGLTAVLLLLVSGLTGLNALFANDLSKYIRPYYSKILHSILGLTTYALVMASTYTALDTDIFLEHSLDAANYMDFRILLKTITVLIFVLSSWGPLCGLIYSKIWN